MQTILYIYYTFFNLHSMSLRYIPVFILLYTSIAAEGQQKAPLVEGKVNISLSQGTFNCDITVKDIFYIKDYLILLNAGMNLRYIKDANADDGYYYERVYDDDISYEAFGYYMLDNTGKSKFIRKALKFSYTGKFPVVGDTAEAARQDWKGNIAFNGYSVRTDGAQAAWYPILYDLENEKQYDEVRYDIEINCSDCSTIYLNSNDPVPGSVAKFKSETPTELLLYAGNYKVKKIDGTYFLNPDIDESQMKELGDMTGKFKRYLERHTGIPYKYSITYLNSTPVSKYNAWMFVSYPTIADIGWGEYGLSSFFASEHSKASVAHELGHYYFGTYRNFNSAISGAISEGFAEYLSAQILRQFYGNSAYSQVVDKWVVNCKDFSDTCISAIKTRDDISDRETYVYNYIPLVLTAIEKETDMETMWAWIKKLLQDETTHTDYRFFEATLAAAINDSSKFTIIRDKYLSGDKTLEAALAQSLP